MNNLFKCGVYMIQNCEDVVIAIKEFLKKENLSKYGNYSLAERYGTADVGVNINLSIDISHVDNFAELLGELSAIDSPISNDGYTGIDVLINNDAEMTSFIMCMGWIIDDEKYKKVFYNKVKDMCDFNKVKEVVDKIIKLESLGFTVHLVYSTFMREEYEKAKARFQKEKEEDLEGHYTINDYPMVSESNT